MQPWRVYALAGKRIEELKALMAPRMAAELPKGEGTDYTIYPEPLSEPYKSRRFQVGELLYQAIHIPREDGPSWNSVPLLHLHRDDRPGPQDWMAANAVLEKLERYR